MFATKMPTNKEGAQYTVRCSDGLSEVIEYKGELPVDRTAAIRLMTRYTMAARDPEMWDEPVLVPVSEQRRDCMEALDIIKKASNPNHVGLHTEARSDAVAWLLQMSPELFELDIITQAPAIPEPRSGAEEFTSALPEAA